MSFLDEVCIRAYIMRLQTSEVEDDYYYYIL